MSLKKIRLLIILSFIFGLLSLSISSTSYALDKSRLLASTALISSLGLKFYGVSLDKSANRAYDEYLHTARQSEMKQHLNVYEDKRSQSLLMSRISTGMAAFALIYSILDELGNTSPHPVGLSLQLDSYKRNVLIVAKREF